MLQVNAAGSSTELIGPKMATPMAAHAIRVPLSTILWFSLALIAAFPMFRPGLSGLWNEWSQPRSAYGPFIAAAGFLLLLRQIRRSPQVPASLAGLLIVGLSLALAAIGNFVTLDNLIFVAWIGWIVGMVMVYAGGRGMRSFVPAIVLLILALPLQANLYRMFRAVLDMIAGALASRMSAVMGTPFVKDANVLRFDDFSVKAVDVFSSLDAMIPALALAGAGALIIRGSTVYRAFLALSAMLLVIGFTALRVVLLGKVGAAGGTEAVARFQTWTDMATVLITSLLLLALVHASVHRMIPATRKVDFAPRVGFTSAQVSQSRHPSKSLVIAVLMTAAVSAAFLLVPQRPKAEIQRLDFDRFPPEVGKWNGTRGALERRVEDVLNADDYLLVDFYSTDEQAPVNLFSAYYLNETQEKKAPHSPEICLPGSGWTIVSNEIVDLPPADQRSQPLRVNRAVIRKGDAVALAYYWFEGRGRSIVGELPWKFYVNIDEAMRGRADGSLVRFITPILSGENEADADSRLQRLLNLTVGRLGQFIPA